MTITADHYARAIVGAARSYGDCPVSALTSRAYGARRCLPPAVEALRQFSGAALDTVCRPLPVAPRAVLQAKARKVPAFAYAFVSAVKALERAR